MNPSGATAQQTPAASGPAPVPPASLGRLVRELSDELFLVFVLVMFLKLFLVEHYKIPSGSMVPTLIGGRVAHVDADGDGQPDIVFWDDSDRPPQVFLRRGDRYLADPQREPDPLSQTLWDQEGRIAEQYDHILVNKLAYWFHPPRRGEVVVFKVPPAIYRAEAPIYIKRLAGEPGETLTFTPEGRLVVDGHLVRQPDFFMTQNYRPSVNITYSGFSHQREITSHALDDNILKIDQIKVPHDQAYVFGDNTQGSLDSRYWGGVPLNHFKGRAFLRIYPFNQFQFLR